MKNSQSLKQKFLTAMDLPIELLNDVPRITLIGNNNLLIENHKGIIEYDENIIRLVSHINILGNQMNVEEINNEEIFITGEITNVEFE
ncbi:MAG: sporulation protein YqfC [Clostridia bacterium]|nr:sporulation protein YqfC [Clostridia bacterium]